MEVFNNSSDSIHGRIALLIDELGKNKNSFSKELGVSSGVIQNIVGQRQSKPGFDLLNKIITSFDVNAVWLLTGEGSVFNKHANSTEKDEKPEKTLENLKLEVAKQIGRTEILKEQLAIKEKICEQRNAENAVLLDKNGELKKQIALLEEENEILLSRVKHYEETLKTLERKG